MTRSELSASQAGGSAPAESAVVSEKTAIGPDLSKEPAFGVIMV